MVSVGGEHLEGGGGKKGCDAIFQNVPEGRGRCNGSETHMHMRIAGSFPSIPAPGPATDQWNLIL